jgi:hypothetical protein
MLAMSVNVMDHKEIGIELLTEAVIYALHLSGPISLKTPYTSHTSFIPPR